MPPYRRVNWDFSGGYPKTTGNSGENGAKFKYFQTTQSDSQFSTRARVAQFSAQEGAFSGTRASGIPGHRGLRANRPFSLKPCTIQGTKRACGTNQGTRWTCTKQGASRCGRAQVKPRVIETSSTKLKASKANILPGWCAFRCRMEKQFHKFSKRGVLKKFARPMVAKCKKFWWRGQCPIPSPLIGATCRFCAFSIGQKCNQCTSWAHSGAIPSFSGANEPPVQVSELLKFKNAVKSIESLDRKLSPTPFVPFVPYLPRGGQASFASASHQTGMLFRECNISGCKQSRPKHSITSGRANFTSFFIKI
jgi:hypothetical protein